LNEDTKAASPSIVKRTINILKFLVAGGLILFLVLSGKLDLGRLATLLRQPGQVAIILMCVGGVSLCGVFRWWMLLKGQGFKTRLMDVFKLTFIGAFFNSFMPGAVGGDLIKAYYVGRENPEGVEAMTTIFLDRLTGLFGLMVLGLAAIALNMEFLNADPALGRLAWVLGLGLSVGAILGAGLFLFPLPSGLSFKIWRINAGQILVRVSCAIRTYKSHRMVLIGAICLSLLAHVFMTIALCLTARALGIQAITLRQYFFLIPIGLAVNAIPLAPGGLGIGEIGFGWLFSLAGADGGANVALAFHVYMILWSTPGAVFYLMGWKQTLKMAENLKKMKDIDDT